MLPDIRIIYVTVQYVVWVYYIYQNNTLCYSAYPSHLPLPIIAMLCVQITLHHMAHMHAIQSATCVECGQCRWNYRSNLMRIIVAFIHHAYKSCHNINYNGINNYYCIYIFFCTCLTLSQCIILYIMYTPVSLTTNYMTVYMYTL